MLSIAGEVALIWFAAASAIAVPVGRVLRRAEEARLVRTASVTASPVTPAERPAAHRPFATVR